MANILFMHYLQAYILFVVVDGLVAKSCLTLVITQTVACQAPLSMGFSRQDYWSGLPFPSPGDLPDPGIKPASLMSPALAHRCLQLVPPGKALKESEKWRRKWQPTPVILHQRRKWQPTQVFLPGESHGQRHLVDCSPQDHTESDTAEAIQHTCYLI